MTALPSHARAKDAGFTLLEMLVALAVLALFVSSLPQAYGLIRRTWGLSAELSRDNPEQTARLFLATRLAEATPVYERRSEGDEIAFTGASDTVTFVAPLTHAPKGGGLYKFRVFVAPDAGGQSALQVSIEPHSTALQRDATDGGKDRTGPEPPEVQRLAPVAGLAVRYFGRPSATEQVQWLPSWTRIDAIPDIVELALVRANGTQAPPITVELRLRTGR